MIPGLGRASGLGCGCQIQYPCLETPHGPRCLVGYSPRSYKELDTTEQQSACECARARTHTHTHTQNIADSFLKIYVMLLYLVCLLLTNFSVL